MKTSVVIGARLLLSSSVSSTLPWRSRHIFILNQMRSWQSSGNVTHLSQEFFQCHTQAWFHVYSRFVRFIIQAPSDVLLSTCQSTVVQTTWNKRKWIAYWAFQDHVGRNANDVQASQSMQRRISSKFQLIDLQCSHFLLLNPAGSSHCRKTAYCR